MIFTSSWRVPLRRGAKVWIAKPVRIYRDPKYIYIKKERESLHVSESFGGNCSISPNAEVAQGMNRKKITTGKTRKALKAIVVMLQMLLRSWTCWKDLWRWKRMWIVWTKCIEDVKGRRHLSGEDLLHNGVTMATWMQSVMKSMMYSLYSKRTTKKGR